MDKAEMVKQIIKAEMVKQIIAESLKLAWTEVRANPNIPNKIQLEVHRPQKRILAEWVAEARQGHIDALNELVAFKKQAVKDLEAFSGKHRRLYDRKEKLDKMGFIITQEEVDSNS